MATQALFLWLNTIDCSARFQDSIPLNNLELVFQFVNGGIAVPNVRRLVSKIGKPLVQCHPVRSTCKVGYVHPSAHAYSSAISDAGRLDFDHIPSMETSRTIGWSFMYSILT